MEDLLRRLDDDPEFADFIAERVRKSAEASVIAEIECAFCKEREPCLEIGFQRPDAVGPFRIGEALPVDLARVDPSAYTLLRSPEGHQLLVLECNQCPKCRELTWYGLVIEGSKLASIWPVALTRSTLGRSHLASAALALEAGRLVGRSPEEMTPTGTLEILSQRLPP